MPGGGGLSLLDRFISKLYFPANIAADGLLRALRRDDIEDVGVFHDELVAA